MKQILITGASSGIGQAIALAFAGPDVTLLLIGRSKERLGNIQQLIERRGAHTQIIIADLSKMDEIHRLIREVKISASSLDALVYAAAIWHNDHKVFAN